MKFIASAAIIALTMFAGAELSWAEESTDNRAPVVNGHIPGYSFKLGGISMSVDLGIYFSDPDDDDLSYTVTSLDTDIIAASLFGDTVDLSPVGLGPTNVEVTAEDPDGLSVTDYISIHVSPGEPTVIGISQ